VQAMIAKFSPTVANFVGPTFTTIDSWRSKAGTLFDQGSVWSQKRMGTKAPGEVLGAVTKSPSVPSIFAAISYGAGFAALHVFSVLKWLVANPGIFYPVFAIGFLFTLWKLLSRFRRPSY